MGHAPAIAQKSLLGCRATIAAATTIALARPPARRFDPAKHPDFLGAILGTGVVRERVGDILVQGEAGAQILVDPGLLEHFEAALTQVGRGAGAGRGDGGRVGGWGGLWRDAACSMSQMIKE